jgi:hypothetical protein
MKILGIMLFVAAASTTTYGSPGGVLEKVTRIRVDPTVVEQPDKVVDAVAPNLARYNLRAAVKDAHLEEGDSPIRAHIVLDQYSTESPARKVIGFGFGSGRSVCTVDGRLVIQDADGKELASVKIHLHGTVAFSAGEGSDNTTAKHPVSDFELLLTKEIEGLK